MVCDKFIKRFDKLKETDEDIRITKRYISDDDTVSDLVDYIARNLELNFKSIVVDYEVHTNLLIQGFYKCQFGFYKDEYGNLKQDWFEDNKEYKELRDTCYRMDWSIIRNNEIKFNTVVTAINVYKNKWHWE